MSPTDLLLVSGFAAPAELDSFVKSEIRYFRSREMRASRCRGAAGEALLLAFADSPDLGGLAAALAARYPALRFEWARGEGESVRVLSWGGEAREELRDGPLAPLPAGLAEIEEIYATF